MDAARRMPFVALERPSLALELLQASAKQAGLSARGAFPSFQLAERIGVGLYSRLLHTAPDHDIGDWLFAGAAFPDERQRHASFLDVERAAEISRQVELDLSEMIVVEVRRSVLALAKGACGATTAARVRGRAARLRAA